MADHYHGLPCGTEPTITVSKVWYDLSLKVRRHQSDAITAQEAGWELYEFLKGTEFMSASTYDYMLGLALKAAGMAVCPRCDDEVDVYQLQANNGHCDGCEDQDTGDAKGDYLYHQAKDDALTGDR